MTLYNIQKSHNIFQPINNNSNIYINQLLTYQTKLDSSQHRLDTYKHLN